MPFVPFANLFAEGAPGMLVYVLGVLVLPAAIGIRLRNGVALAVVLVIWLCLMLLAANQGWLDGTDDISTAGKAAASAVLILLPAEAVAAFGVVIGRRIRRLAPHPDSSAHR